MRLKVSRRTPSAPKVRPRRVRAAWVSHRRRSWSWPLVRSSPPSRAAVLSRQCSERLPLEHGRARLRIGLRLRLASRVCRVACLCLTTSTTLCFYGLLHTTLCAKNNHLLRNHAHTTARNHCRCRLRTSETARLYLIHAAQSIRHRPPPTAWCCPCSCCCTCRSRSRAGT
eukprot:scaffold50322_cov62-Phaeocystis_antarctica.AAC.1